MLLRIVDLADAQRMKLEIFPNDEAVAKAGAAFVAAAARQAIETQGTFTVAFSGGSTPWKMLAWLRDEDVPWERVHLFQVDERVAPRGHQDRNLTHLESSLLDHVALDRNQVHAMPVEEADLDAAARTYAAELERFAGSPPALDLIHLGLGGDGHTASLVPGDAVLDVTGADVAVSGVYQGRRRITLTYPALDRAKKILWLISGESKREMLQRLLRADKSIPAGRVRQDHAVIFADEPAAA